MQELFSDLDRWQAEGTDLALATLVSVRRSAPRLPGARMLVTAAGEISGSISGGCVEADIVERALKVLETGQSVVAEYGISDEQGFDVGLSCGGEIDVLIQPFVATEAWTAVRAEVEGQQPAVLAIGLSPTALLGRGLAIVGGTAIGTVDASLDAPLAEASRRILREGAARTVSLTFAEGEARIFIDAFAPPRRLFIVGATHVAMPLASMAKRLGYRVIVVDARSALATEERFPEVDELLRAWPDETLSEMQLDERSSVVVLTHDPKFDLPVLETALRSDARYIGAMGSRKTHARRVEHLERQGFDEADVGRIHAPIGLDIGGGTPEELALAILAEVVATQHGRTMTAEADG